MWHHSLKKTSVTCTLHLDQSADSGCDHKKVLNLHISAFSATLFSLNVTKHFNILPKASTAQEHQTQEQEETCWVSADLPAVRWLHRKSKLTDWKVWKCHECFIKKRNRKFSRKCPPLLKLLFLSTTQTYHVSAFWKLLLMLPVTSDLLCSCDTVRVQPPSADCNWLTSDSCVDPAPSLASHAACSLNICRKNSGLNRSKVKMPLKESGSVSKWLRWSIFTVCYDETIRWHHQFNTLSQLRAGEPDDWPLLKFSSFYL